MIDQWLDLDPWENVTAADLAAYLNSSLVPDEKLSTNEHLILFPERRTSIRGALTSLAAEGVPEEEVEDHLDDIEYLLARFASPQWVVTCFVTDSLVSGTWGLREVQLGSRGYLYVEPDFGMDFEEEDLPVLAAWEPFEEEAARRRCILSVYTDNWSTHGWPPFMGQWAKADPGLLYQAVGESIDSSLQNEWPDILERIDAAKRVGGFTSELLDAVAELSGADRKLVEELVGQFAWSGGETNPKFDLASLEKKQVFVALFVLVITPTDAL